MKLLNLITKGKIPIGKRLQLSNGKKYLLSLIRDNIYAIDLDTGIPWPSSIRYNGVGLNDTDVSSLFGEDLEKISIIGHKESVAAYCNKSETIPVGAKIKHGNFNFLLTQDPSTTCLGLTELNSGQSKLSMIPSRDSKVSDVKIMSLLADWNIRDIDDTEVYYAKS